jgi:hypothetical protein
MAGALIMKKKIGKQMHFQQFATGAMGPMDSF